MLSPFLAFCAPLLFLSFSMSPTVNGKFLAIENGLTFVAEFSYCPVDCFVECPSFELK